MPRLSKVAAAIALSITAITSVQAVEYQSDDWTISFDSTLAVGASWRLDDPNPKFVGISNGGTAFSTNGDDGNLNFESGDAFSKVFKGLHELDLNYKDDFGLFTRFRYFYDAALMDDDMNFKPLTESAEGQAGKDVQLLDAFVYGSWDLSGHYFQARLGKQVINWGESTFIQHSIAEASPINLSALRTPGSELREAFVPIQSVWGSLDISESFSLEAYLQFDWKPFRFDPPGTLFAPNDFIGAGGTDINLGFGIPPEGTPGTVAVRTADREADDDGQFGVKLTWFAEALNQTEFGFYFVNYHNKRPIISAYAHNGNRVEGFVEYVEDIEMYGVSFNTVLQNGLSVAGEVSYRVDEPLQVDDVELLFATLEPVAGVPSGTSQIPGGAALGEEISGFRVFDTVQAQTTLTQLLGPTWGANQFTVLAEIGANWIDNLPDESVLRFEGPGTSRSGNIARAPFEGVEPNSFADDFSWGYRLVGKLDYNNAFLGVNMSPRVVFQHDVSGNTPVPISNFIEDRKAIALGVGFDYQSVYKWDIVYSSFYGAGSANNLADKDFISVSFSYSI